MNTENTVEPITETADETSFRGEATYCPEDNKLRLYVGRVPRDEYLKLRADGWTPCPKQRESGGGDFAATWTPARRDTALEYAGFIGDEDKGPAERAADRAERFSGYRDKRTNEACGHADRFDSGPQAHGYQSQARAERAAARHDRIADRAGDAWGKAEYWTTRTAGVISHALYKSTPGVRMGRIKTIEADLRRLRAGQAEYAAKWQGMKKIEAMTDAAAQTEAARRFCGCTNIYAEYMHPRIETVTNPRLKEHKTSLYTLLTMISQNWGSSDITGAEACALFFSDHREPATDTDLTRHLELRLAYENQMLAAAGGMLEQCEVLPGGKLGGKLIIKVSKSSVTKRATSCDVLGPKVSGWTYKATNIPGTEFAAYKFDLERIKPEAYTAPTAESLAELKAFNDSRKANAPKSAKAPLINPTDADAERLQAVLNDRKRAELEAYMKQNYCAETAAKYLAEWKPSTVCRITQARYSEFSKGAHARAYTREIGAGCEFQSRSYNAKQIKAVCELRQTWGDGENKFSNHSSAPRIIVLTDKPQKPLPAAVWGEIIPAMPAQLETVNA